MSLLVLEGNSSAIWPLPRSGAVLIGRTPEAGIPIQDASVSRQHARVTMEQGEVSIADLGSHNGVRVNGERVFGTQPLRSGDVVVLGNVTLVFHGANRPPPVRPLLDDSVLRTRLAEELERVRDYEREVSVLALEVGTSNASLDEVARVASGPLRRLVDLVGRAGSTLAVVLPELASEEAEALGEQVLEALSSVAPLSRAGLATAPRAGLEVDALLAAARAAALAARPGGLRISGPEIHRLDLGEKSIVVADPAMVRLYELLRRLAGSHIPVLIHGETGVGKEHAARAVHYWSSRQAGPFKAINCSAFPEGLAESELFGHERGAFSGAERSRAGVLEQSSGGTLFLDEVAELPLPIQAKLLRALDQKRITRLGDSRERDVDLRVVAATHKRLADEVKAGRFREDLFFRLAAAVVVLPPLRDRPIELPLLASSMLAEACARANRPPMQLSAAAMAALLAHSWPGNVRELKNVIERAVALSPGALVEPSHLGQESSREEETFVSASAPGEAVGEKPVSRSFRPIAEELRALERQRMEEALEATDGVQTRAAQLIGMPLRTFAFKLKQYKIAPRRKALQSP